MRKPKIAEFWSVRWARLLFPLLMLLLPAQAADYPRDLGNIGRWTQTVLDYASACPQPQRLALEQIVADAQAMARLDIHKAYDALEATVTHLEQVRSPISNFGEVMPGRLWRGAQPSPAGLRWLAEQGIGTIIVLREPGREDTNYPGWSREQFLGEARGLGFEVVEIPIRDTTGPTPSQVTAFLDYVDSAHRPCFVHCSAGIGRTGVMAGLYLRHRGASPEEALSHALEFMLRPTEKPDHAVQAAFLENYPLQGSLEPVEPLWRAAGPPGPPLVLDTPDFKALTQALAAGRLVRFVFTPENLDLLGPLSRAVPVSWKRGQVRGLSRPQLERVRRWLGEGVPLEVVSP